jgi:hypothetical protein
MLEGRVGLSIFVIPVLAFWLGQWYSGEGRIYIISAFWAAADKEETHGKI